MSGNLSLSEELLIHADVLESEFLEDGTPEERRDWPTYQRLVEAVVTGITSTREGLQPKDLLLFEKLVRQDRTMAEGLLDAHYAILGLKQVRLLVARTIRLDPLQAKYEASPQTNRYIREAAKAYVVGLPMASVAMSRAALEQALKDRLGKQRGGERDTFGEIVDSARRWNILDADEARMAKRLGEECNQLLHEKPIESDDDAFEILTAIRSLVERVFTAEGGF
jgi:hypothetical protein